MSKLKQMLSRGEAALGCFIGIPAPGLVEMAGYAGFDFVIIDNEHGPLAWETVENMLRAAEIAGVPAVVRVPTNSPVEILKALDVGAAGVQVPWVNSPEEARRAVQAARYHPQGNRGIAFSTRAAGYGLRGGQAFVERSNRDTLVILHVETVQALEALPRTLEIPGIDAMFFGPSDLSQSMGYPGQPSHPDVVAAIERGVALCRSRGVVAGTIISEPTGFQRWAAAGVQYIPTTINAVIARGMREMLAARPARD